MLKDLRGKADFAYLHNVNMALWRVHCKCVDIS